MATILINNVRGNKVTETLNFVLEECCSCGTPFFMTVQLNKMFRNNPDKWFFCPNGHEQHYSQSDAQKRINELTEQVNQEKSAYNRMVDEMIDERSKAKKLKAQLNRVHKGVCPCCNRTFINLQKHMETKHLENK